MKEFPTSSPDELAQLGLALYMQREVFQLHPFCCEGMKWKASRFLGLSPALTSLTRVLSFCTWSPNCISFRAHKPWIIFCGWLSFKVR